MHRHASLLILAGLMTAPLHAQTASPPTPTPAVATPSQRTPPPARVATTPPLAPTQAPPPAQAAQTAPPSKPRPGSDVPLAPVSPQGAPPSLPRPGTATPPAAPAQRERIVNAEPSRPPTQNVRVDLTITDGTGQRNAEAAAVKVVTMLVADGRQGRIRSSNNVRTTDGDGRLILINIDAIPSVRSDGRIELSLTIEYTPDLPQAAASSPRPSSINESLTVLVADGKSTLISQSADPATARKVSVEVTATIVK